MNKNTREVLSPVAVKSRLWTCTEHNRFSGVVKLVLMAPNHPTYNTAIGLNRRTLTQRTLLRFWCCFKTEHIFLRYNWVTPTSLVSKSTDF